MRESALTAQFPAGALAALMVAIVLTACDLPLGLGLATTQVLESGAADSLDRASSFEITGAFTEAGNRWSVDAQLSKPTAEHLSLAGPSLKIEAVILGNEAYFRGQEFLSQHLGADLRSRDLVLAAGQRWWKGSADLVPRLPNFTGGGLFRRTFLGPAATRRSDHLSMDGVEAVEMSGPRADVYIAAQAPHRVLRVRTKEGVTIDGVSEVDFRFGHFNENFAIAPPRDLIDFSNLSTLPPIYTVVTVDSSGCASPCLVSAVLKNLGGTSVAKAPSKVTFTLTATVSGRELGRCQSQVRPEVGFNATTTVGCTIDLSSQSAIAAVVTAVADNPGSP